MSTENSDIAAELQAALDADADPAAEAARVDDHVAAAIEATAADAVPKAIVRSSLPAVLLALLEIRDAERHGQALREDLQRALGHEFSPGSVYPRLHDLDGAGTLAIRARGGVEKHYAFDDYAAACTRIEQRAEQHAAMARFLHGALEELDT